MTDEDGFRVEAALQYGFEAEDFGDRDEEIYQCKESQLIAFAKACERKGMISVVSALQNYPYGTVAAVHSVIESTMATCAAIETDNAPVREAAESEFMTARGYTRAEPGARWIKVDQSDAAGADFIERRAEKMAPHPDDAAVAEYYGVVL